MKNNKGFSILELIVSFSLTMIIIVVLFEIIVYMKDLYEKSVTQTELINRQNLITDYIYNDLTTNEPTHIFICGDNCIGFSLVSGETKQLKWDESLSTLGYGSYTMSLIKNTNFDQTLSLTDSNGNQLRGAKICYNTVSGYSGSNSYVSIKIPLTNALFSEEDFGVNILYTFDYNTLFLNLPLSSDC